MLLQLFASHIGVASIWPDPAQHAIFCEICSQLQLGFIAIMQYELTTAQATHTAARAYYLLQMVDGRQYNRHLVQP